MPKDTATFLRFIPVAMIRPSVVIHYLTLLKEINPHYADIEVTHIPPQGLDVIQQQAYLRCSEYLHSEARRQQGVIGNQNVAPPLLLIHGAPGTGKSFIVDKVVEQAISLGVGTMSCAFTGAAATNLVDGMTILSMFGIQMSEPGTNVALSPLPESKLASIRILFKFEQSDQIKMLFIDEISLVNPILLSMIDKRLKEIFNNNIVFGGMAMILLGDFQQLDPVAGKSLSDSVQS